MASATIVEIADAVVARLNDPDNGLPYGLDASRAYVPVHELKDLGDLKTTVVPAELSMVMLSRRDDDFDYVIDVGIQHRVDMSLDQLDARMLLVEEVMDLFRGRRLEIGTSPDLRDVLCVSAANAPIFDPAHLDEKRVFTSVLRFTFRLARAR